MHHQLHLLNTSPIGGSEHFTYWTLHLLVAVVGSCGISLPEHKTVQYTTPPYIIIFDVERYVGWGCILLLCNRWQTSAQACICC